MSEMKWVICRHPVSDDFAIKNIEMLNADDIWVPATDDWTDIYTFDKRLEAITRIDAYANWLMMYEPGSEPETMSMLAEIDGYDYYVMLEAVETVN